MIRAAGIMFLTDAGQVLLLRRGPGGDWPGAWNFPGGKEEPEDGGDLEKTAVREVTEEIGSLPDGERAVITRRICANETTLPPGTPINPVPPIGDLVDYTTFLQRVPETFSVTLSDEHTAYAWINPQDVLEDNAMPAPIEGDHPG